MSFLARYFSQISGAAKRVFDGLERTDSTRISHSMLAYKAPTLANPRPLDNMFYIHACPLSRRTVSIGPGFVSSHNDHDLIKRATMILHRVDPSDVIASPQVPFNTRPRRVI